MLKNLINSFYPISIAGNVVVRRNPVVKTPNLERLAATLCDDLAVQPIVSSGKSFWNVCTGESSKHREWVYSALGNGQICRNEHYKWIHRLTDNGVVDEVYDITIAPRENRNIANSDIGQCDRQPFYPYIQDLLITKFRRKITDLHPCAV
ncbi:MAG: hypothetical protein A2096_04285 [Spirochaetes bacterium GWF1_41_5]|nr:MAG: hypothetical protein A2096_04285 [Spirochaetes bacterium GWF1_41_5]